MRKQNYLENRKQKFHDACLAIKDIRERTRIRKDGVVSRDNASVLYKVTDSRNDDLAPKISSFEIV